MIPITARPAAWWFYWQMDLALLDWQGGWYEWKAWNHR
jgi:hypothetical protein